MARPKKNNLEYFSHDCDLRNDVKIRALRRKYGHTGYSIYLMMLEHLGNCEYLQYEWSDISIELITPDFDIDATELKDIINYCVHLNLFQLEDGIIYCQKFYERNQQILNKREGFNLRNSPLSVLREKKLSGNEVNSEIIHKGKERKEKENKVEESKVEESISKESKGEERKEQFTPGQQVLLNELKKLKLFDIVLEEYIERLIKEEPLTSSNKNYIHQRVELTSSSVKLYSFIKTLIPY